MGFYKNIVLAGFGILLLNELLPAEALYVLPRPNKLQRSVIAFHPLMTPIRGYHRPKTYANMPFRKAAKVYLVTVNSDNPNELQMLPVNRLNEIDDINELSPVRDNLVSPYTKSDVVSEETEEQLLRDMLETLKYNILKRNKKIGSVSDSLIENVLAEEKVNRNVHMDNEMNNGYVEPVLPESNNVFVKKLMQRIGDILANKSGGTRFKKIGRSLDIEPVKSEVDKKSQLVYDFSDLVM